MSSLELLSNLTQQGLYIRIFGLIGNTGNIDIYPQWTKLLSEIWIGDTRVDEGGVILQVGTEDPCNPFFMPIEREMDPGDSVESLASGLGRCRARVFQGLSAEGVYDVIAQLFNEATKYKQIDEDIKKMHVAANYENSEEAAELGELVIAKTSHEPITELERTSPRLYCLGFTQQGPRGKWTNMPPKEKLYLYRNGEFVAGYDLDESNCKTVPRKGEKVSYLNCLGNKISGWVVETEYTYHVDGMYITLHTYSKEASC